MKVCGKGTPEFMIVQIVQCNVRNKILPKIYDNTLVKLTSKVASNSHQNSLLCRVCEPK